MSSEEFIKDILQIDAEYNRLKAEAAKRLEGSPNGTLRISTGRSGPQYFHRCEDSDKENYISKKDLELVRQLAQKSYDEKLIRAINRVLPAFKVLIRNRESLNLRKIYLSLSIPRQALVTPAVQSDKAFLEFWYKDHPSVENSYPKTLELFSENGEQVRSKSEKIIADTLLKAKIPYLYETALQLSDHSYVFPDFKVLNLRTRKTYYWEHFGRVDDPEYANNSMLKKIRRYETAGIFPGEQLIMTFESEQIPLSTKSIQQVIQHYLL